MCPAKELGFPCFIYLFIWPCWVLLEVSLAVACGISSPDQGTNPGPLYWEFRVLATGPPGKSLGFLLTGEKEEDGFQEPTGCVYCKMLQGTGRKYFLREEINMYTYLVLCNPVDCSPPGSSVHGVLQARILEWVAIPFSRGSS